MDSGHIPANNIKFREIVFDLDVVMQGFTKIRLSSLFLHTTLPCDFFFPTVDESKGKIEPGRVFKQDVLFAKESRMVLLREGIDEVYIRECDESIFLDYFYSQLQSNLSSMDIPTGEKTKLLYDSAEIIIRKIFREHPNDSNIQLAKTFVDNLAVHLENEEVTINALLSLCTKDYCTFNHCVQVAIIGMAFCRFLGWHKSEVTDFGIGALFHDIGKNSISNEILNKPDKLNDQEFELIKQHSVSGYHQLFKSKMLKKEQLDIVLYHHEAMDGSGYPEGIYGNKIPRYARLAHIIDVFDALSSERAYKRALSNTDALRLMQSEMRASLDEEILDAFSKFIDKQSWLKSAEVQQIGFETGKRVSLQAEPSGARVKTCLVGMEPGGFLLFKVLDPLQLRLFQKGMPVTARYIHAGEACGFKETIIEIFQNPYPLIFLPYPAQIEKFNLRREKRADCILPATIVVREKGCRCLVIDLSFNGCRINIRDSERDKLPLVLTDEMISITSHLSGSDELVLLKGQVKNLSKNDHGTLIGMQFGALSEQSASSLRRYVGLL